MHLKDMNGGLNPPRTISYPWILGELCVKELHIKSAGLSSHRILLSIITPDLFLPLLFSKGSVEGRAPHQKGQCRKSKPHSKSSRWWSLVNPTATRNSGLKNGPLERRYLLDRQLERPGACAAFPNVVPLYFFSVGAFRGSVYRFLSWG